MEGSKYGKLPCILASDRNTKYIRNYPPVLNKTSYFISGLFFESLSEISTLTKKNC